MDVTERFRDYCQFLESMSPGDLGRLEDFAAPDAHYHDPFVDARGVAAIKRAFRRMFEDVDAPSYTVTHRACDGQVCFLRWHFTCRPKNIKRGLPWVCDGVSEVHFDDAGRVTLHIEHWDAGEQVYEKMPVLRAVIRFAKRRISGWT